MKIHKVYFRMFDIKNHYIFVYYVGIYIIINGI